MAVIKCKMCGGDLILTREATTAECEFCGSVQTIPTLNDEKMIQQFERAERLRKQCEFDKAAALYEAIVSEFSNEPEAYWGIVLCKYGVEYVDDPATGKKVPTCHRSSFDSIMEDYDFELVLENADLIARRIYREEAKKIEELRKDIISVSSREAPYDIFICYKETDETGGRSLDSVLAQDVYNALTDRGYRVFFSRVTLEDKLGMEYEPHIFAALNSARIMLAFGTDYEHFNAVWVKNEWSRFLKIMAKDKTKYLIPCFKGIDAYDMPKEFTRFQAQDMGKIGALQDLLRGIEKLLPIRKAEPMCEGSGAAADNFTIPELLRKAQVHLENRRWKSVLDTCKRITAADPENAWAYIYQLARVMRVTDPEQLGNSVNVLDESEYYSKALRCADSALAAKLQGWCAQSQENSRLAEERCAQGQRNAQLVRGLIAGGAEHTVAVRTDGTVLSIGSNEKGQCETSSWRNIIAVACGREFTAGLRDDGTVVACGNNEKGQCEVNGWKNIVAISTDEDHLVGLCADGTVVSAGNDANGKRNVADWTDIQAISCGYHHTLGLRSDGTLVATGSDRFGQCKVSSWPDVVYVASNNVQSIGLRKNGTVQSCGSTEDDRISVRLWKDIVDIGMGTHHTLGLKADGTLESCGSDSAGRCTGTRRWRNVVGLAKTFWHSLAIRADGTVIACGEQDYNKCSVEGWKLFQSIDTLEEERREGRRQRKLLDEQFEKLHGIRQRRINTAKAIVAAGQEHILMLHYTGRVTAQGTNAYQQCDVGNWSNIKAVACGEFCSVGLREDGTVVASGNNEHHQCDVSGWKDIAAIFCGERHTVGLRKDGTVVACGNNEFGQCAVEDWNQIQAVACGRHHTVGLKKDGTVVACGNNDYGQCNVKDWRNVVAIAAKNLHTVGLRESGTVVACGGNERDQCNVAKWEGIVSIACGTHHTVGLKTDGTVIACGCDWSQRCSGTKQWKNISGIVCGLWCTIGIPEKGGICFCGELANAKPDGIRLFGHIDTLEAERQWCAANKELLPRLCRNWQTQIANGYVLDDQGKVICLKGDGGLLVDTRGASLVSLHDGNDYLAGLCDDGTVVCSGQPSLGRGSAACWENIIQMDGRFNSHVAGLRRDGTVIACGDNTFGQCNVAGWTDVKQVNCAYGRTVGLRTDGSVVACGDNELGQCNTAQWTRVAQIVCGHSCTLGLRTDGTVLACGSVYGDSAARIAKWQNITQIAIGLDHVVGLRRDGTVAVCGNSLAKECAVQSWRDIVAIACGNFFTIGLTDTGTLVACGNEAWIKQIHGMNHVKAIAADHSHVYILLGDGTVCYDGVKISVQKVCRSWERLKESRRVQIPADPGVRMQIHSNVLQKQQTWRAQGLCQHCSGMLKGVFTKKCSSCGLPKDY